MEDYYFLHPSRETEFPGANEDRGKVYFPSLADHKDKQDWQQCPVDSYSAESADHTSYSFVPYSP